MKLSKKDWYLISPIFIWSLICIAMVVYYVLSPTNEADVFDNLRVVFDKQFKAEIWCSLGMLNLAYLCFVVPYLKFDG